MIIFIDTKKKKVDSIFSIQWNSVNIKSCAFNQTFPNESSFSYEIFLKVWYAKPIDKEKRTKPNIYAEKIPLPYLYLHHMA